MTGNVSLHLDTERGDKGLIGVYTMSTREQISGDGVPRADFGPLPGPPPMRVDGQPNVNAFFAWVGQIEVLMVAREAFAAIGFVLFAVDTLWGRTDSGGTLRAAAADLRVPHNPPWSAGLRSKLVRAV